MKKVWWYALLGIFALLFTVSVLLRHHRVEPHSVTLTWHAPAPRSGVTLVGYNVYRRTAESELFIKIAEKIQGPPYEDRLVSSGRKYVYVVTSVDKLGRESRFSAEAAAEIP
jgi:fibronectin type 3 domain-containing protein